MNRVLFPVALTASVVLLVTAAGSADSADPASPTVSSRRLALVIPHATVTPVRLGGASAGPEEGQEPAPAPGDSWLFSGALVHESDDKVEVGTAVGQCLVIGDAAPLHCTATLRLADGQITLQGTAGPTGDAATLALTGGTARYARWHGQAQIRLLDRDAQTYAVTVQGR